MGVCLVLLCLGLYIYASLFWSKYLFAAITILMGDKKSLDLFGNLCDEDQKPLSLSFWELDERERNKDEPLRLWRQ